MANQPYRQIITVLVLYISCASLVYALPSPKSVKTLTRVRRSYVSLFDKLIKPHGSRRSPFMKLASLLSNRRHVSSDFPSQSRNKRLGPLDVSHDLVRRTHLWQILDWDPNLLTPKLNSKQLDHLYEQVREWELAARSKYTLKRRAAPQSIESLAASIKDSDPLRYSILRTTGGDKGIFIPLDQKKGRLLQLLLIKRESDLDQFEKIDNEI